MLQERGTNADEDTMAVNEQACKAPGPALDDEFLMHSYKVLPCKRKYAHDWASCPCGHKGERAARRDLQTHPYMAIACQFAKQRMPCPSGERCPHAHNLFEYWLHPQRFKTELCQFGANCDRPVCFFSHSVSELRYLDPSLPPAEACWSAGAALGRKSQFSAQLGEQHHNRHMQQQQQQQQPIQQQHGQAQMLPQQQGQVQVQMLPQQQGQVQMLPQQQVQVQMLPQQQVQVQMLPQQQVQVQMLPQQFLSAPAPPGIAYFTGPPRTGGLEGDGGQVAYGVLAQPPTPTPQHQQQQQQVVLMLTPGLHQVADAPAALQQQQQQEMVIAQQFPSAAAGMSGGCSVVSTPMPNNAYSAVVGPGNLQPGYMLTQVVQPLQQQQPHMQSSPPQPQYTTPAVPPPAYVLVQWPDTPSGGSSTTSSTAYLLPGAPTSQPVLAMAQSPQGMMPPVGADMAGLAGSMLEGRAPPQQTMQSPVGLYQAGAVQQQPRASLAGNIQPIVLSGAGATAAVPASVAVCAALPAASQLQSPTAAASPWQHQYGMYPSSAVMQSQDFDGVLVDLQGMQLSPSGS